METKKRGKLEIIRDILEVIRDNRNYIKTTPLMRKSNLSSARFKEYYGEMLKKELVLEKIEKNGERFVILGEKGFNFLEKYKAIIGFIDEFEL